MALNNCFFLFFNLKANYLTARVKRDEKVMALFVSEGYEAQLAIIYIC